MNSKMDERKPLLATQLVIKEEEVLSNKNNTNRFNLSYNSNKLI